MGCQNESLFKVTDHLERAPNETHLDAITRLRVCADSILYDGSGTGTA